MRRLCVARECAGMVMGVVLVWLIVSLVREYEWDTGEWSDWHRGASVPVFMSSEPLEHEAGTTWLAPSRACGGPLLATRLPYNTMSADWNVDLHADSDGPLNTNYNTNSNIDSPTDSGVRSNTNYNTNSNIDSPTDSGVLPNTNYNTNSNADLNAAWPAQSLRQLRHAGGGGVRKCGDNVLAIAACDCPIWWIAAGNSARWITPKSRGWVCVQLTESGISRLVECACDLPDTYCAPGAWLGRVTIHPYTPAAFLLVSVIVCGCVVVGVWLRYGQHTCACGMRKYAHVLSRRNTRS